LIAEYISVKYQVFCDGKLRAKIEELATSKAIIERAAI